MITVKDIMIKDVIIAEMDFTLEIIEKMMERKGIGHIFVVRGRELLGVISDGDLKRHKSIRAGTDVATFREEQSLKIKAHQLMTRDVMTLSPQSPILEALDFILHNDIHCLPVVEKGFKLVGVVTTTDLLRLLKRLIEPPE